MFRLWDTSKDGVLQRDEVRDLFASLGVAVADAEFEGNLDGLFAATHGRTGLTKADFIALVQASKLSTGGGGGSEGLSPRP